MYDEESNLEVAYALVLTKNLYGYVLLKYMAVLPWYRGKGVGIAAMRLIREDFKITREHGQWFDVDGRRYMAIYHPSALLRDPSKRPETFVDLKTLQREIYARCPEVYPDA